MSVSIKQEELQVVAETSFFIRVLLYEYSFFCTGNISAADTLYRRNVIGAPFVVPQRG